MPDEVYLLPIIGVIGKDFKYTDVLMHLNAAKNSQYIKLVIDSPGGYIGEGEKIKEALKASGKVMFSANSGDVASYAVTLFEIAPKGNRFYDPAKGVFLIHMPFVTPEDGVSGTAADLEEIAKELKKLQNNIIGDYAKSTGTEANVLEGFMNEDVPLTPEQVESLGFARIQHNELKAVAYFKNDNDMNNEETVKKLGVLETLLAKVVAFIMPKSLMVQDVNGKELDFGPAIETPEQIAVGAVATVDGVPADGDYAMADGTVYKFTAGALVEIVAAADPNAGNEEVETLKAEVEALKAELATAQNFKAEAEKQVKDLAGEFAKFKNQFSTGDTGAAAPGDDTPANRRAFKK